jgi:hypothetical protein
MPRRLNSARCTSTKRAAYSRQRRRTSAFGIASFFARPIFRSTSISIGSP